MNSIDYYAYTSKINNWNSSIKIIFAFLALLINIVLCNIGISIITIIYMMYIVVFIGGLSLKKYLSIMKIPLAFIVLGTIAVMINISKTASGDYNISFKYFYIVINTTDIIDSINLIVKALAAISCMYMMTLSTTVSEIIVFLNKIYIPKLFTELMSFIYRYIFILMDVQINMKISSESRLGYRDYKTACRTFGKGISNLLIVSLRKSNDYFNALESRGYDGELLFLEEKKSITAIQIMTISIYIIVLTIILLKSFL